MHNLAKSVAVLFFTLPIIAQQQEKIEVVLIEVLVSVVDRSGNSVKGLTAENFELIDEGRKRPITHFEAIDLSRSAPADQPFTLSPVARRKFLVVFDLSHSSPGTLDRAAEAAREFIRKGVRERDLVGVATFNVERGFDWITSFTTDRRTLLNAVEAVGTSKFVRAADPLVLSVSIDTAAGATPGNRRETKDLFDESAVEIARRGNLSSDEMQRARIRLHLDRFAQLARILDRIHGQKQVILLSEGFDARLLQGRESTSKAEDDADMAASVHGEVWNIDNDQRFGNTAAVNVLDHMASVFRRSDVVMHAIDIKGLRSDVDAREGRKPTSTESLFLMSNPTGGQLFKNTNEISENFARMLKQQQAVYVLGFQVPAPGSPGKFHNLKVRVKDVPGARLFHRPGYYEPSPDSSPLERTLSAAEIMVHDIPHDDIAINMLATSFPAERGNPQVPVIVEIKGPTLLKGVRENSFDAEIFLYAFDRDLSVRDFLHQKMRFDLTKVRDRLAATGVKFYGALNLPPGDYDVKALVRVAQSGRVGFERLSVHVPDFTQPSLLLPFIVGEEGQWIMAKAAPRRPADLDYPFTIASESFIPQAAATMTADGAYEVALFGYHINPEGLQLSVNVQDQSGAQRPANVTLVGRTPSGAPGPAKFLFNFKPAGLAAGAYALNFDVKPEDRADRYRVSVPFVVH